MIMMRSEKTPIIQSSSSQSINNVDLSEIGKPKLNKRNPVPSKPPVVENTFQSAMYNLSKKALELFFLDPACSSVFLIMYPIMRDLYENYIIIDHDEQDQVRSYQAQLSLASNKKKCSHNKLNKRKIKDRKRFSVPATIRQQKNLEQLEVYREKAIIALNMAYPDKNWRDMFNVPGATVSAFKIKVDTNGQVLSLRTYLREKMMKNMSIQF